MKKNEENLIGRKFNYWTSIDKIERLQQGKEKVKFLKCECICGKIKYVNLKYLKNGCSKSCGCKNKRLKEIGQIFRYLTVIEQPFVEIKKYNNKYRKVWFAKCRCVCGLERIYLYNSLLTFFLALWGKDFFLFLRYR